MGGINIAWALTLVTAPPTDTSMPPEPSASEIKFLVAATSVSGAVARAIKIVLAVPSLRMRRRVGSEISQLITAMDVVASNQLIALLHVALMSSGVIWLRSPGNTKTEND